MSKIEEMTSGLQTRDLAVKLTSRGEESESGYTFTGIGVPYNEEIQLFWHKEKFAPGSVDATRALILWNHDSSEVIGKVTSSRDTDAGFEITATLSKTSRGQDAAKLLADGVIDRMSIGFYPQEYSVEIDEDTGEETIIHTKVQAREFSLVPFPAYESAAVTNVRHQTEKETPTMETLTRNDLSTALEPVEQELETIKRSVAMLDATSAPATSPAASFRSMGEFVQAAARGEEAALTLHEQFRAAEGTTSSDVPAPKNGENFLGTTIRLIEERRKFSSLFTTATLPAKGMTVEYAQFDTGSFQIAEQSAELEDLVGPSSLKFKDASAPVKTYGGWTRLSRQAIERAPVPYLDTLYKGMSIKYAKVTDAAVKKVVEGEMDKLLQKTDGVDYITLSSAQSFVDWVNTIIDASDIFDDRGFEAVGLAVGSDIFKEIASQQGSDGRPLMDLNGTAVSNIVGTINLTKSDGSLLRVPVKKMPNMTGRAFFWDPVAVEIRESAGAPVLLQDENIINLGKEFSLYGYMAVTVPFPGALLPVKIGS